MQHFLLVVENQQLCTKILLKAFPNLHGALAGATEFVNCAEIFLCDWERNLSAYGQCSCAMMMVLQTQIYSVQVNLLGT